MNQNPKQEARKRKHARKEGMHKGDFTRVIEPTHKDGVPFFLMCMLAVAAAIFVYNQVQISALAADSGGVAKERTVDYSRISLDGITSTASAVSKVFDVSGWKSMDDVTADMLPTGTPEYGDALGVSFDAPEASLARLSQMYPSLKNQVEQTNPEAFKRFMNMASQPMGVSCELCCGVGPVGVDSKGNPRCGCQHISALLSIALWLTANTDYSDGQVLHEVMRWKTMFFPQKMVNLGASVIGGADSSVQLPQQVGGC